jgi:zinc transport system ATP-binding protein
MTPDLLTVDNLGVTLGGVPILRGLSASIPRGKVTAIIGLNGSGKTTFLRALLREVPYTGRVVFHCGHNHDLPFPQHMGYVPQRLLFDPNLPVTVCELISLAVQRRPLFLGIAARTKARIKGMLERVWAAPLYDRPVATLSGGELQRVLLALALEPEPELLLLDEPAAGIDFKHEGEFYALIARLNERTGVTVVLVSHDLSVVSRYAHQVLCLNDGRIQCTGDPREVLTGEMVAHIFGEHKGVYTHHDH